LLDGHSVLSTSDRRDRSSRHNNHAQGGFAMSIMQLTRFKSANSEEMIKAAKQARPLFEKHGAEWLRVSRFHAGEFTGQWLAASRYLNWEVYGKAQDGLAKDPEYAKLMAHMASFSEMTGRNITAEIDH
jgi:hypothetical protein